MAIGRPLLRASERAAPAREEARHARTGNRLQLLPELREVLGIVFGDTADDVKEWQFQPAMMGGKACPMELDLTGEFPDRTGLTAPRTYGITYGMGKAKKTTIYLPDRLKRDIERVAQNERRSEADVIRDAVESSIYERRAPEPRIPLVSYGLGAPDIAERAEELLDGFGR